MNPERRISRLYLIAIFLGALCLITLNAAAADVNSPKSVVGVGQISAVSLAKLNSILDLNVKIPSSSSSSSHQDYCFKCLPSPMLIYMGKENYTTNGMAFTRYKLSVDNRDDYPASLFKAAPYLPPCGLNTNSSRTWVNIYDKNDRYLYGFCALSSPSDLANLWFAVARGSPPPDMVYLTMTDRTSGCNVILKSALVQIH